MNTLKTLFTTLYFIPTIALSGTFCIDSNCYNAPDWKMPIFNNGLTTKSIEEGGKLFGYFKVKNKASLDKIANHTNVIHITTADPYSVSLEQVLDWEKTSGKKYKFIIEWQALRLDLYGQNGCQYNKCHVYDHARFQAILNTVIDKIQKPLGDRIIAHYIVDEPETNDPSLAGIEEGIHQIRMRREMDNTPILINFDNVWEQYTGAVFRLPRGVDWVSVTPSFGRYCFSGICETNKYTILLNAVSERNKILAANKQIKLIVVGDAWSESPDQDYRNNLTVTGYNHLTKVDALYNTAFEMAKARNIEVKGMLTFAYDWFDNGAFALSNSTQEIQDAWRRKGLSLIKTLAPTPVPTPTPTPAPTAKQFTKVQSSSVLWPAENAIDGKNETVYSSRFFSSEIPNSSLWIAAWTPTRRTVSKLELTARTHNGQPLGFPKAYRVYVTAPDNSKWNFVGNFVTQPNNKVATLNFIRSYQTYGVLIVVDRLGVDDNRDHYFQLAEIRF